MNPEATDKIEPWLWRIAGIVIVGSIMSILDTTIVNVALDRLDRELHTSIASIQWVVTGYLLSLAAVIPVSGWAGRRFGPKRVYLTALVLFTAGSMLCGIATSATELIVFRVMQGIGGGLILPVGQLMTASAAGPRRMGRVLSVVAVPAMLAPILGPAVGGLILDNTSWRWIFFVNVPIGVIAFVAALRGLPRSEPEDAGRLDVHPLTPDGVAGAYSTAFWWSLGITALAIVPSMVLLRAERDARRSRSTPLPEARAPEPIGA